MAAKFRAVGRSDPRNPTAPKKYYPILRSTGRVTLRRLAERIALMSTVSTADTMAVLESLLAVVPQELGEGRIVQLGDLGSFSLRIRTEASTTEDEVTARKITSATPAFRAGRLFKDSLVDVTFEKEQG